MTGKSQHPSTKIAVVVGTRPEAIKLAPLILALQRRKPRAEVKVVLTGQHDVLATAMLQAFGIEPDLNLKLMRHGQSLYDLAHGTMEGLRNILQGARPDLLVVQGDTASVFFGALVGFFERIPVAHVEAGLRSGTMEQPFPEEGFRRLTSVLTALHFAPTRRAEAALLREGIPQEQIHVVGNSVVDALETIRARNLSIEEPALAGLIQDRSGDPRHPWALLTTHRRESQGEPMRRVFESVRLLALNDNLRILYPVHPNPTVRNLAEDILGGIPTIHLVDPLSYSDLVHALASATLVLTDSGGIQEEAPTFGTPVLILRDVTERPEGIEAGVSTLVGTDPDRILTEARRVLQRGSGVDRVGEIRNPYGDGFAGERMARTILSHLQTPDPIAPDTLPAFPQPEGPGL
jgi:UDP-N-acetylglucosamine 2-epimerase (non-hydrolysing)